MLKFETTIQYDNEKNGILTLTIKSLDCENNNKYDPCSCGIYIFLLDGIPLYIGEAGIFLNRLSGHLNKCSKNISYFGLEPLLKHSALTIQYAILAQCNNENDLKKAEDIHIKRLFPITQYPHSSFTRFKGNPNDCEYEKYLKGLKNNPQNSDTMIRAPLKCNIVEKIYNTRNTQNFFYKNDDIIKNLNGLLNGENID